MSFPSTGCAVAPTRNPEKPAFRPQPAAPWTCASCAMWRVVHEERVSPGEGVVFAGCTSEEVRQAIGRILPPGTFGCHFWAPQDPVAYRASLFDDGVLAIFDALYAMAGRTRMPKTVEGIGKFTRERIEIAVVRLAQRWGLI